jgi:hypothetical protein
MTLSIDQLRTLHALSARAEGKETGFLRIGDAQRLTELGLARRNRAGWEITLDGASAIEGQPLPAELHAGTVLAFARRVH